MASDLPRISKLAKAQLTPRPALTAVPTAVLSWIVSGGGFTQANQYYKFTALRKSRNDVPVWEGESLAGTEQTLAGASGKDHPRAVVTPGSDADGFRIYQSLTAGAEKLWAEVRLTRDANGNITGASLQSPYNPGSIVTTTSTTVTWDGPSGQDQAASGGNPTVPTTDTSEIEYIVLPEYAFIEGPMWDDRTVEHKLADGTDAISSLGFVDTPKLKYEATSSSSRKDMRKAIGWRLIRLRLLPNTDWAKYMDVQVKGGEQEEPEAEFENATRRFTIGMAGILSRTEPADPFRS